MRKTKQTTVSRTWSISSLNYKKGFLKTEKLAMFIVLSQRDFDTRQDKPLCGPAKRKRLVLCIFFSQLPLHSAHPPTCHLHCIPAACPKKRNTLSHRRGIWWACVTAYGLLHVVKISTNYKAWESCNVSEHAILVCITLPYKKANKNTWRENAQYCRHYKYLLTPGVLAWVVAQRSRDVHSSWGVIYIFAESLAVLLWVVF